jgi:glycosyltransferase involved in cell wall biosynthesis
MITNHCHTALLVPVYNAEKYIKQFHQSIQDLQTKFDDIVFYNDGSTDNSHALLSALGYSVIDSEVNKGPAFARNQLIQYSNAAWVHFHDIDDIIYPQYLSYKLQKLQENYDAIICDADWVDVKTNEVIIKWRYINDNLTNLGAAYLLNNPVGGINGLYKRSTLLEIGGFDENLKIWEDADLNLRLCLKGKNIYFTENVLVKSLRHINSTSNNNTTIQQYKCMFLDKHADINEPHFKKAVLNEADQLYHSIVYTKNWELYNSIILVFKKLGITPPLSKTVSTSILKGILGSKNYTILKYLYLKHILKLKI